MAAKRSASHHARSSPSVQLLPGERVRIDDPVAASSARTDDEIVRRFAAGETRIITEHARYPLQAIPGMLSDTTRYKLDPSYQRRRRWMPEKASRLIESFIMNVPVPPVFLYEYDLARYEVMDGQQRLSTIRDFYADKIELCGLQYWPELNKRTYSRLPPYIRDGIDRGYLSSIVLLKLGGHDETNLKQFVFERINSGGVRLEPQEQRNALYPGPLNDLCKDLAEKNEGFKAMWILGSTEDDDDIVNSAPIPDKFYSTMMDVELVLRFFAYRQIHSAGKKDPAWNEYLDAYLREGNLFPEALRDELKKLFEDTVALVHEVLGSTAFCMWRNGAWYRRPQKGIYDAIMYGFSACIQHRNKILEQRAAVAENIQEMYGQHSVAFRGRATNRAQMRERNRLVADVLGRFV